MHKALENLLRIGPQPGATGQPVRAALGPEAIAGAVAAIVTLVHCLSFSALIFTGPIHEGLSLGLWGFMAGVAGTSILAAFVTTLPPMLASPRNPVVAVMSVLAAVIVADIVPGGGSAASATRHVLLALAIAAALTGLALWLIGQFRLGQIVRFVPYPVIGGFLAASGWFLIMGGLRVATGRPLADTFATLTPADLAKLWVAISFAAIVHGLRRLGSGSTVLPLLFLTTALVLDLTLWFAGLRQGWFLEGASGARFWSPLLLDVSDIDWLVLARASVEMLAIVGVSVFGLPLDISSLEIQRRTSADIDSEFRSSGIISLLLAPIGGLSVGVAPNSSRLIDELGGASRFAGLAGGVCIAIVALSGIEITAVVPTPLLAGLAIYLGVGVLGEALFRSPGRSWIEQALAAAIMLAIVRFGYLTGVILGLVGACILFAIRYSRIDAIRRHLTRATFSSGVERAPGDRASLAAEGHRIHLFWLNGFVFFGSSNRIFEEIRAKHAGVKQPALPGLAATGAPSVSNDLRQSRFSMPSSDAVPGPPKRNWVILDLGGISGIDSSAVVSFEKLRNWAETANVILVLSQIPAALKDQFSLAVSGPRIEVFASRSDALEWCEEALLGELRAHSMPAGVLETKSGSAPPSDEKSRKPVAFDAWLTGELGAAAARQLIDRYLERHILAPGEVVCRQGEIADAMHFIADGSVGVSLRDAAGRDIRVRRMVGCTVIGEMGFFRAQQRSASVVADRPAVVYVLSRDRYAAMAREHPALAQSLLEFIVRTLADRVEFANGEIAALV